MRWTLAIALTLALTTASSAHDVSHHAAAASPTNSGPGASASDEAAYLTENDAAMTKMMNDMAVKPTGDIDRDFVAMMVPHHQGAVDMARAILRYGRNEQLRRIAQEIIVDQLQEIAAMRLAVGEPLPPATAAPTQVPRADGAESRQIATPPMHHAHQEP
jgi:uncharacterized protein (DUF305 family)